MRVPLYQIRDKINHILLYHHLMLGYILGTLKTMTKTCLNQKGQQSEKKKTKHGYQSKYIQLFFSKLISHSSQNRTHQLSPCDHVPSDNPINNNDGVHKRRNNRDRKNFSSDIKRYNVILFHIIFIYNEHLQQVYQINVCQKHVWPTFTRQCVLKTQLQYVFNVSNVQPTHHTYFFMYMLSIMSLLSLKKVLIDHMLCSPCYMFVINNVKNGE